MRCILIACLVLGLCLGRSAHAAEYEISPGDSLHVVVLGQTELSADYTVNSDGIITFPFVGKVKAAGMTVVELERKLATLLAEGYLKRPQVAITVKEFGSQRVFVTGEIQKPGAYSLKADRSLLALLSQVGEMLASVGHEVIVIRAPKPEAPPWPEFVPESNPDPEATSSPAPTPTPSPTPPPPGLPGAVAGSEIFRVKLRELRSGNPLNDMTLEAGDTVFFPKAAQIYVLGRVVRPGPYRYEEGMTVFQALLLAGGASDSGAAGRVKLTRLVDGRKKDFKPKPADLVQPEDTLSVPERIF